MRAALVTHPDYVNHLTGSDHPESPARVRAVLGAIESSDLASALVRLSPDPLSVEQLATVHARGYLVHLEALARSGGGSLDPDTVVSPASFEVARLAAGGAVTATAAVLDGRVQCAFAVVRPPGHHATTAAGMGFCLLNNAALAARRAAAEHGLSRIFLIDWDVHHGNGTQEIFYRDRTVLYLSLHQENWYPGTGAWAEVGEGEGEGFTINIPLPAETGDEGYRLLFEEVVVPLGRCFGPELTIISAGYDAHFADPLGGMRVTAAGFRALTELVLMANASSQGRVVGVLEGGYNLLHLPHAVLGTLEAFTGTRVTTREERVTLSEAPYHALRERARRARSIVHTHWNI